MKKKLGSILARKAIGVVLFGAVGGGWYLYKEEKAKNAELRAALKDSNAALRAANSVIRELNKGKEVDPE